MIKAFMVIQQMGGNGCIWKKHFLREKHWRTKGSRVEDILQSQLKLRDLLPNFREKPTGSSPPPLMAGVTYH